MDRICRIKVSLRHIRPPIWRRFEIAENVTMDALHDVLQIVMGWTDSHLHEFRVGTQRIGIADGEDPMTIDEKRVWLGRLLEDRARSMVYAYDFGDDWEHDVVVESLAEVDPKATYPRCLAGKRACPPEDCGGPHGYEELLRAFAEPDNQELSEIREWAREIHPEKFDVDAINRRFKRLQSASR